MNLELNKEYVGRVVKIVNFGAFVELEPGVQGLLHISEIRDRRIKSVEDEISENEEITVKVISLDNDRIGLSMKRVGQE
ncbi:S1 RNA-binding domain-containing protein [Oceanivirga salmonicida]|uniref:S1 RNA-binding domain-containing protein n=1 Tax=Oceanivirga salmonicida TaxID=1769291 RepID=UPI00083530AE|nr:S1 RNA-binding domain-containing protein [Oceanivirga salmonicida]